MGGAVSQGVDNDDIINKLKVANYIKSAQIEKVFRLVDRGNYILEEDRRSYAYKDTAWRRGNLHLSAPCIYAQVMEGLNLREGKSFLNLGSGTGYLSTMVGLILGPYGTNHGVELHGDVIAYAREKLENFQSDYGAIDVLDFCMPQFVQGNAYRLDENVQQYDCVYCGAALKPECRDTMQGLLKIGGILVAPVNDQLLQIERISTAAFTTKSLLPVSFSSLVRSSEEFEEKNVVLPSSDILSLLEMCRLIIRQRLRNNIENLNVDLAPSLILDMEVTEGRSYNPSYSDTDDMSDTTTQRDATTQPDMSDEEQSSLLLNSNHEHIGALLALATAIPRMRRMTNRNEMISRDHLLETTDEGTSSHSASGERYEENDDNSEDESAMACDCPTAKCLPKASSVSDYRREVPLSQEEASEDDVPSVLTEAFDICLRTTETALKRDLSESSAGEDNPHPSYYSSNKSSDRKAVKREKFDSGIGDEDEIDTTNQPSSSDSDLYDFSEDSTDLNEVDVLKMRRRGFRKRSCSRRQCHGAFLGEPPSTSENLTSTVPKKYTELMTASIKRLPLPVPLKIFINYNRDL